ncbi:hypothetical protein, partial [Streptomyces caniscabiei]
NFTEIVLAEQDFDGFLNKLREYPDIEYLGEVIEHSWGQQVIQFYHLNGHIIEVGGGICALLAGKASDKEGYIISETMK